MRGGEGKGGEGMVVPRSGELNRDCHGNGVTCHLVRVDLYK